MTARKVEAKSPKPPGRIRRALARARRAALPYAAWLVPFAVAALLLAAWWPLVFALGGVTHLAGDRLRLHLGLHRKGGKAAMRKRRRYQGEATAAELGRLPAQGVPVGTVRRFR